MDVYRRPYQEPGESRRPTLTWPREIPLDGEPPDVVEIVDAYAGWLSTSDVPKLFRERGSRRYPGGRPAGVLPPVAKPTGGHRQGQPLHPGGLAGSNRSGYRGVVRLAVIYVARTALQPGRRTPLPLLQNNPPSSFYKVQRPDAWKRIRKPTWRQRRSASACAEEIFQAEVLRSGEGPPLLYLHGAIGQKGWAPFLDRLAEEFTVYAPYIPGYSNSTGLETPGRRLRPYPVPFGADGCPGTGLGPSGGAFPGGYDLGRYGGCHGNPAMWDRLVLVAPAGTVAGTDAPVADFLAMNSAELEQKPLGRPPKCPAS